MIQTKTDIPTQLDITQISLKLPKIVHVLFLHNDSKVIFCKKTINNQHIIVKSCCGHAAKFGHDVCEYLNEDNLSVHDYSVSFNDGIIKIIYNDNTNESLSTLFNKEFNIRQDQHTEYIKAKDELIQICHSVVNELLSS
jgi:hypothetical protein